VSEILDVADRDLATVAEPDDIVVSEQVLSYLLAQISENRDLSEVFDELLQAQGSEVYTRPVEHYVRRNGEIGFATLVEAAARRGETAFGYRVAAESRSADSGFGVHLNPRKSTRFRGEPGDRLIVLAED